MVSCTSFRRPHSPEQDTPHNASNGVRPITCRNRHCAKCQTNARDSGWLLAKKSYCPCAMCTWSLLCHTSFLVLLCPIKRLSTIFYFAPSAATLLKIAADPKHLGAEIGFMSVLHSWGQTVLHHPHVHCVIPAGGLSFDHQR